MQLHKFFSRCQCLDFYMKIHLKNLASTHTPNKSMVSKQTPMKRTSFKAKERKITKRIQTNNTPITHNNTIKIKIQYSHACAFYRSFQKKNYYLLQSFIIFQFSRIFSCFRHNLTYTFSRPSLS